MSASLQGTCRALVLDLDGVIAPTHDVHVAGWQAVERAAGLPTRSSYREFAGAGRDQALINLFSAAGRSLSDGELRKYERLKTRIRDERVAELTPAAVLPGVANLLRQARQTGAAVVCLATTTATPVILQKLKVADAFDLVVAGEELRPPKKESAAMLLKILRQLGVQRWRALYIDDGWLPCRHAAAAGVPSVLVGDEVPPNGVVAVSTLDVLLEELFERAMAALVGPDS